MTRPTVTPVTEAYYAALPEVYRDADEAQASGPSGYPLLRYIALIVDQLEALAQLVTRITYVPLDERSDLPTDHRFGIPEPWQRFGTELYGSDTYGDVATSDLVDPYTADAGWLPWLAQLIGVPAAGFTVDELRARLANPADGWAHGTPAAITREARRQLGPSAYVGVVPHLDGSPFTIGIITKRAETFGATSWRELETTVSTWRQLEAVGSWRALEASAVMAAVEVERPAGYRFRHRYLEDTA